MIIVGLGFKASAAPFHQWTPDVYEGSPTSVTAFMAAATKVAALLLTLRILVTAFPQEKSLWTVAIAVIAVCSLVLGNFAALVQKNLKRMLAYSSISNAGFMLIAVSANSALGGRALLFYLIPYAAASLGAFAVIAARERELGRDVTTENLAGMGWERPVLGASMWVFMLSFAGLPPTGGFLAKFYVFSAAYDAGMLWLVIVGVLATAVSLLHGPPMYYTPDWDSARSSVCRLASLEPEVVVTGHGRAMRGSDMRRGLRRLADEFDRLAIPEHGRYVSADKTR